MRQAGAMVLFLAAVVACHESPTAPGGAVPFNTVWKEQFSAIHTAREEVITTEQRWNAVWAEIVANRSPKPALPSVDFSTSAVILVARGDTSDGCHSIEIDGVEARDGSYRVSVQDQRRPASCACPGVVVTPVHAVAVQRLASTVAAAYRSVVIGNACN